MTSNTAWNAHPNMQLRECIWTPHTWRDMWGNSSLHWSCAFIWLINIIFLWHYGIVFLTVINIYHNPSRSGLYLIRADMTNLVKSIITINCLCHILPILFLSRLSHSPPLSVSDALSEMYCIGLKKVTPYLVNRLAASPLRQYPLPLLVPLVGTSWQAPSKKCSLILDRAWHRPSLTDPPVALKYSPANWWGCREDI